MSPADLSRPVVRFGVFEVDLRTGELRKAGVRIAIQDQPFRVLARLLEHPGDMVSRDELRRGLWPDDTFVDFEHGLNVAIKRLRDALGDDAEAPRFVETLPRRGYRFVAPVTAVDHALEGRPVQTETTPRLRAWRPRLAWALAITTVAVAGSAWAIPIVSRRPAPLAASDTILIADFVNKTGDEVFDGSLRQGLTVHLAQSPSFSIVSRERMRDTLKRMTRQPDDPVVGDIAREVCQRVGAKVTINGSVAPLGRHYVIGLEAVDCWSGATVAIEQTEAPAREYVLRELGSSASRLRRQLGESLASIRQFDTPLEQATTPSIDALKAFTIAEDVVMRRDDVQTAVQFLTRAITLDPDFAMAHAKLSIGSAALGQRAEEVRHAREAYARRDRVTEAERLYIEGRYCVVLDDPSVRNDCFMKAHEVWKRTYPRDWLPHNNLAAGYLSRGQYAEAIDNGLEAIRLNPDQGFAYANVVEAYMDLNQFADARRVMEAAITRGVFYDQFRLLRFALAFVAEDEGAMAAERRAVAGTQFEPHLMQLDSEVAAFHGRLRQSRLLRSRAERIWLDKPVLRQTLLADGAIIDATVGLQAPIPEPSEPMPRVVRYRLAVAALLSGNAQRAATMLRDEEVPAINLALVAAARTLVAVDTGDALAADRGADTPRERDRIRGVTAPYLRGLAHLHAGSGQDAAVQFQWIIDHRGVEPTSPLYPLAYLQHGRASVLTGDVSTARRDYETFLTFWKDADPDVPILKQARAEYAALVAVATDATSPGTTRAGTRRIAAPTAGAAR